MNKKLIVGIAALVTFSGAGGVYAGTLLKTPRGNTYYTKKENVTHNKVAVTVNGKTTGEAISVNNKVYMPINNLPKDSFKAPVYNKSKWSYNIDSIIKTIKLNDPTKLNQAKMNADIYDFHVTLHLLNDRLVRMQETLMMWDGFIIDNYDLSSMQDYNKTYDGLIDTFNTCIDIKDGLISKYTGKPGFYQWDIDTMNEQMNALSDTIDVVDDAHTKLIKFANSRSSYDHQSFLDADGTLVDKVIANQNDEIDIFNAYYGEIMKIN